MYAEECKLVTTEVKGSIDALHKELEKFTAKLIDVIVLAWKCSDVKEAVELLNEAEQYQLMGKGRIDLATIIPMQLDKDSDYIIQLDESLPPHYDQLINELKQIKERNYPKTPTWMRNLEEYKQAYFSNLDSKILHYTEVVQDFNQLLLNWTLIQKKSLNLNADLQQIANGLSPLPSWFNKMSLHHREMIQVLAADPSSIEKKLKLFKKQLTSENFREECGESVEYIYSIPQWYWVLPEHQQFFLEHVLKGTEKIEDAISFPSSRMRTLPLPSNYAVHSLFAISKNGEKIRKLSGSRYRSSHIASRDGLEWPEAVQKRHSDSNLAKVMEFAKPEQPSLLQTLISPIHAMDYVPNWFSDFLPTLPPDLELYKLARAAVERRKSFQTIQQNNHPYNIAKRVYFTQSTDPDSLELLSLAKKYIPTVKGLESLIEQYKSVLNSKLGSATCFDYAGRELFLSSLEQLIILTIGGHSYGSCVSGKDRKAIEAMILYKEKYGSWPLFTEPQDKENRIRFVALVADLYLSRHQHEHAGQNAPGSEGIKSPDWYFPEDIASEIKKRLDSDRALKNDDRIATDNEVKNIFIGGSKKLKEYLLPGNKLLCRLLTRQIGEENCTKIYNALHLLINEKNQFIPSSESNSSWKPKLFSESVSDCPEGIKLIRELMLDPSSGKDNVLRLEKILQVVSERPKSDSSRTQATNSVYECLRSFLKPSESKDHLNDLVQKTIEEWTTLFNLSKANTFESMCLN
ncbi:MAG: oxidoreductase [Legionella longbeachae]|nr:oxidoreductase [Legionella longbeachae]